MNTVWSWSEFLSGLALGYLSIGVYLVGRLHGLGIPSSLVKDAVKVATWPVSYPMARARLITASCPCARNRNVAHPCEVPR